MSTSKIYLQPKSVEEALAAAYGQTSCKYLAGGTDLLVNKFQGNANLECLIDISGIVTLKEITITKNKGEESFLEIGTLVTLEKIIQDKLILQHLPSLAEASHQAASPIIRKTATLGGNLLCENRCSFYNQSEWWRTAVGYCLKCEGDVCIATGGTKACFSKFVSDTAPLLISLEAKIELADEKGTRTLPLEEIYSGNGIDPRTLSEKTLLVKIIIPLQPQYTTVFKKLRPREAVDFTSLTSAVSANRNGKVRIVLGGVDPKPVLVVGNLEQNPDDLIKQAIRKSRIVDNDFYSRDYRKEMIKVFLYQSLTQLKEKFYNHA